MALMTRLEHVIDEASRLPLVSRLGGVVIVTGIVLDTIVHVFLEHDGEATIAGFSVPEHAAHLVVLVGMILVIDGVMTYGARMSRSSGVQSSSQSSKERRNAL